MACSKEWWEEEDSEDDCAESEQLRKAAAAATVRRRVVADLLPFLCHDGRSGGRRGVPRGRPVRPPDRAKKGDLRYGQVYSRILYRNYIDQQISSCFLQDLQSEWEKEQMQKVIRV